ncbi:PEPxxWA-CTERM sorting domain-containing protein [uncultured Sphingomonas sp.]|uniref:PEPxxWA-CTERM sorting domain-containing protein n=1 Tax=uncultured Sphingomonas sp. TaxID=158754 RepID=UPI0035CA6FA7
MGHITRGILVATAATIAFGANGEAAAQRQILTAVNADPVADTGDETKVSATAGATVATTFGGADARAKTDFGVNKIYASGGESSYAYASSAWLDTFTVGGATGNAVHLSFAFTIDGAVGGTSPFAEWNYQVYAMRGGNWSLNGYGGEANSSSGLRNIGLGDGYDTLILQQTVANPNGRITRADARDFDGFWNYANVNGDTGNLLSNVEKVSSAQGTYYEVTNPSGPNVIRQRFYADHFERAVNDGAYASFQYGNAQAGGPQALTTYNSLLANYSLIATGGLCAGPCSGMTSGMTMIDPTTFTLDFDLAAGSVFTLASWLYADDVSDGAVDFFNTAKVTGVSVSTGGTLSSASGALTALPGGGYGYPAAVAGVPEPAAWTMMITGFGLIGGALRRRRGTPAMA